MGCQFIELVGFKMNMNCCQNDHNPVPNWEQLRIKRQPGVHIIKTSSFVKISVVSSPFQRRLSSFFYNKYQYLISFYYLTIIPKPLKMFNNSIKTSTWQCTISRRHKNYKFFLALKWLKFLFKRIPRMHFIRNLSYNIENKIYISAFNMKMIL